MRTTSRSLVRVITRARPYSNSIRAAPFIWNTLPRITPATRTQVRQPLLSTPRFSSSLTIPPNGEPEESERPPEPTYQLTFTCKPCSHRSSHRVTKHGIHQGTVLIQCPNCKNRHVISDHLKIFNDEAVSLEDILQKAAGPDKTLSDMLKKGRLGQRAGQLVANEGEEDIEFWDDGTVTKHQRT